MKRLFINRISGHLPTMQMSYKWPIYVKELKEKMHTRLLSTKHLYSCHIGMH